MRKITLLFTACLSSLMLRAQGTLSGDLMLAANFYQKDSAINAANNPLYDNYLSGGEAWLGLRYNYKGFTATLRVDAFHNSNLYDPTQGITGFGVGAWSLSKDIDKLSITAGYIYDQVGSGILFRAYEDRGLLIDNALAGIRLKYQLTDHIYLKGFTGQMKRYSLNYNPLDRYAPVIKGFNAEGDFNIGEKVHIIPGIGVLNRSMDQGSMDIVVSTINTQPLATRFIPKYNMYAFCAYNTLTAGDFSWYVEGAYKSKEAISVNSSLIAKEGNVVYSTLGFARKGIAVNLSGKRTENFVMRTSPNEILIRGLLNWQPIVARLRPYRLMARYTPASQDISELALGGDVLISPSDELSITLNYTHINTLTNVELYREAYAEAEYRGWEKFILQGGLQYMQYNQELYQVKPAVPIVNSLIPFFELTYRIDKKKSIRAELEYQSTAQDYGSWIFGLLEFTIAPNWSFAVSDMYNTTPGPSATSGSHHYYNVFTAYSRGPHRFTLSYVKQVEGINCTGGVCRYEPAFSGVRFGATTSF